MSRAVFERSWGGLGAVLEHLGLSGSGRGLEAFWELSIEAFR